MISEKEYLSSLEKVEKLIDEDPLPNTKNGRLLRRLAKAVEEYEKKNFLIKRQIEELKEFMPKKRRKKKREKDKPIKFRVGKWYDITHLFGWAVKKSPKTFAKPIYIQKIDQKNGVLTLGDKKPVMRKKRKGNL